MWEEIRCFFWDEQVCFYLTKVMFVHYFYTWFFIYIFDSWVVPGCCPDYLSYDVPERIVYIKRYNPTEFEKFLTGYINNMLVITCHIDNVINACLYYYNKTNPNMYYEFYFYLRHDFLNRKRFFLKIMIVAGIIGLPIALYESYEYGFPKEYLYIIPVVIYSSLTFFFMTINYEIFINYMKNSWFYTESLYIPQIDPWEDYIYLTGKESYPLTKIKQFYSYVSTESINAEQMVPWEEPVYKSDHISLVRRYFRAYIKPRIKSFIRSYRRRSLFRGIDDK